MSDTRRRRSVTRAAAASLNDTESTATSARVAGMVDLPDDLLLPILRRSRQLRRNERYGEWEGLMWLTRYTSQQLAGTHFPGWPAGDILVVKGEGSTYSLMHPDPQRRTRAGGLLQSRPGAYIRIVMDARRRAEDTGMRLRVLGQGALPPALQRLAEQVLTPQPQRIQFAFGRGGRYKLASGEFWAASTPSFVRFVRRLTGWT